MEGELSHLFWDGMKCSLEEPTKKNILKERFLPWLSCLILRWLKMVRMIPSLTSSGCCLQIGKNYRFCCLISLYVKIFTDRTNSYSIISRTLFPSRCQIKEGQPDPRELEELLTPMLGDPPARLCAHSHAHTYTHTHAELSEHLWQLLAA